MSPRLSRRNLVLLIGAVPVLARAAAQTAAQTPPQPLTPEQRVEKAKADVREVSDQLSAMTVPMDVEPSFRFVA